MQQVVIAEQNKNGKAIIYDETLFSTGSLANFAITLLIVSPVIATP